MHFATQGTGQQHALAFLVTLEIHMLLAGQNVLSTQNVLLLKHAGTTNVQIHAQVYAEPMQSAESLTTLQHVHVTKDL